MILLGRDNEYYPLVQKLFEELTNTTLQMCVQLTNSNTLAEKSDVIDAYFGMVSQMYEKVPHLIPNSSIDISALFQCAVTCLNLPNMQAMDECSEFLVHFITQSRETNQAGIVETYGESLVLEILICVGGAAPRDSAEVLSDIILTLNKKYCDNLARWLHTLLQREGFPSPRVTMEQKENFIKAILRKKANKRKVTDIVMEFTLACRGLPNHPHYKCM